MQGANFLGVKTPNMADFRLPQLSLQKSNWKEVCTVSSWVLV